MPANMMNALVGSRLKVTGRSTATVSAGPMPGSTPTAVPRVTPTRAHPRCGSVSAPANPSLSAARISSIGGSDQAGEHAGGELQVEDAAEQEEGGDGDGDGKERVAHGVARVEGARDTPEERDGGDDEAAGLGEEQIEDDAGSDEGEGAPVGDGRRVGCRRVRGGRRVRASMDDPLGAEPAYVREDAERHETAE